MEHTYRNAAGERLDERCQVCAEFEVNGGHCEGLTASEIERRGRGLCACFEMISEMRGGGDRDEDTWGDPWPNLGGEEVAEAEQGIAAKLRANENDAVRPQGPSRSPSACEHGPAGAPSSPAGRADRDEMAGAGEQESRRDDTSGETRRTRGGDGGGGRRANGDLVSVRPQLAAANDVRVSPVPHTGGDNASAVRARPHPAADAAAMKRVQVDAGAEVPCGTPVIALSRGGHHA
jgi:hypothetical protein